MATARLRWLVAVAGMAIVVGGCGSTARRVSPASRAAPAAADPAAVSVIRAWSDALRRGDVAAAASYFALPSEFVNGGGAVTIHTEAQARAVNATLPCGALLISAARRGRFVSALFRLTDRPGPNAACGSGAGQLARTNFVIADGRIVDWIRAPDPRGGPAAPSPTPGGGPVV